MATPHPFTYVALGASGACGIGTSAPETDNWPAVLALQLGADTHLVNLGVPGTTLSQALTAQLPVAVDAPPHVVTGWLAVHDLLPRVPLAPYTPGLGSAGAPPRGPHGGAGFSRTV